MLKILTYLVLTLTVCFLLAYLYIFRDQDIRVDFIPPQFRFCGEVISKGNANYDNVVTLLKENKSGWETSFVSFVPSQVYDSPGFRVNILENTVVVSYKTDDGYPQYVKNIRHDLGEVCAKHS